MCCKLRHRAPAQWPIGKLSLLEVQVVRAYSLIRRSRASARPRILVLCPRVLLKDLSARAVVVGVNDRHNELRARDVND